MKLSDVFQRYTFTPLQEQGFQKRYNENQLISVRVGLSIALLSYALYAFSDSLVAPSADQVLFFYRFVIICPILGLFLALSMLRIYRTLGQKIYTLQMLILGSLHVGLLSLLNPSDPGFNSYYGGLILIIGGLGVLGGLQLKNLLFTSIYIVICYQLMAIFIQDMLMTTSTLAIFIINNLFLLTAIAISAFTAYLLENYSRKDYLQSLELRRLVNDLEISQDKIESTLKEQIEWSKLFTRYIRHEMGNTTIGVSTSLQLIKRKTSNEDVIVYTERAEHSLNELKELLKKASDATSIDEAFSFSDHQDVEICQLLETLCDQYNEQVDTTIEHELKDTLWIKGSPLLLKQLFRNLIDNAIRHSHPQKPVRVKVQGNNTVLVENEGDQLPQNKIEKLFLLGNAYESKNPGLYGLGLHVAKKVAAIHGGSVVAEPLETVSGARFKVAFSRIAR